MAADREFSGINIAKLLLSVFIVIVLVLAFGTWIFYSSGHRSIEHTTPSATPPSRISTSGCR